MDAWFKKRIGKANIEVIGGDGKIFEEALRRCAESLKTWGANTFGNIPKKVKLAQKELEELNASLWSAEIKKRILLKEKELDRLLALEEYYWKQRSWSEWLRGGKRNTKFFHSKATQRWNKYLIKGLEDANGVWVSNKGDFVKELENYFSEIFSASFPDQEVMNEVLEGVSRKITPTMSNELDCPFTPEEVREAAFHMGAWKSPGPDGFHSGFYQKNWELVGADVTKVCLQVLNDHRSVNDLNYTFIVFILKVKVPRKVSEFRSISLCNVIYKIITKTSANRLKKVLTYTVSEEQSAFVSGRLITDNIIVAYETMHTIRRKTGGKDGLMALKLDMSKAYDRVEWSFLGEVMIKLGFSQRWAERVMDCVAVFFPG